MLVLLLSLLIAGCSTLRLAYRQAPPLSYWWLDGQAAFDEAQAPLARQAVDDWFRWHRETQLADYAGWLRQVAGALREPIEPAQVCGWADDVDLRLARAFDQALPPAAELVRQLRPAQFDRIERRQNEKAEEFREEYLEGEPDARRRQALERTRERVERFYGRLDAAQLEQMDLWLRESPFDPARWLEERAQRQADLQRVLRGIAAGPVDAASAQAALRGVVERMRQSPREDYRDYALALREFNCRFVARVHGIASDAQRVTAVQRLEGWAADLQALAPEGG